MSALPRGQPRTAGLLALACSGLLGVIYLQLDEPSLPRAAQSMPSDIAGALPVTAPDADLEFAMPPAGAYGEIAARPLFSPTRRPSPPPEAGPQLEESPQQPGQLLLRGTAIAGDSRVALVERRGTGELLRARVGQTVDGWRVAAITPRNVVLERADENYILEVEKDAPPPTVGQLGLPDQASGGTPGDGPETEPEEWDPIESEGLDEPVRD